ncbi:MAG: hypothetical protein HQ581_15485 [Planctomycetes bacterium]|nr:hypothetical protein [Planctomycetota bacterium]
MNRSLNKLAVMVLGLVLALTGAAHGINYDFDNGAPGDSDWNSPQNWTGDTIPGVSDNAFILDQLSGNVTINITSTTPVLHEVVLARDMPGNVIVNHSGGTLENRSWFNIGQGFGGVTHTGTYNMTGNAIVLATHAAGGETALGAFTGAGGVKGTLTISDNAQFIQGTNDFRLGGEGVGAQFNADGELIINNNGIFDKQGGGRTLVGRTGTGTVTINDNGSFTTTGGLLVGESGIGIVNQNGGTVTANGGDSLVIAANAGSQGTYTMTAGTLGVQNNFQIGARDQGTFDQSGGTATWGAWLAVGRYGGGDGTLSLSGNAVFQGPNAILSEDGGSAGLLEIADSAAMTVNNNLEVGRNGTGIVDQTGGTLTVHGDLLIAVNDAATGSLTLGSGDILVTGGVMRVGDRGTGTMNQTGGSVTTHNWFVVGQGGNKTSTYNMSGGTLDVNTNGGGEMLEIGVWDTVTGVLNLSGNAQVTVHNTATNLSSAHGGTTGILTVADNATLSTPILRVGNAGTGQVTQSGGTVTVTGGGDTALIGVNGGSHGTYTMTGGTFNAANLQTGGDGTGTIDVGGNAQLNVGGWFVAGRWAPGVGTITLQGNAVATANNNGTIIAELGTGTMNIRDNATLNTRNLDVALNHGVSGTLNQSGGTVNVIDTIEIRNDGAYNMSGGIVTTNRTLMYGTVGNPSELNLSGNAVYNNNAYMSIAVGGSDEAVVRVQDNAQLLVGGDLNVSDTPNSQGTLYLDGGLVRGNIVFIGKAGGTKGIVHQTGGELHSNNYFNIGTAGGSTGEYHLDGGIAYAQSDFNVSDQNNSTGTLWLNDGLVNGGTVLVGKSGGTVGTVHQAGGEVYSRGNLLVANSGGSTGVFNQSGGLVVVNNNPQIGTRGNGTLNQSGGLFYHVNHMAVGRYNGSSGTYNMTGDSVNAGRWIILAEDGGTTGQMNVSGNALLSLGGSSVSPASLEVARNGTATLNQTGGMVYADTAQIAVGSGNGTYNLGGGILETRNLSMGPGTAAFNFTGGALRADTVAFSLDNQGGVLDVATPMTAGWNVKWYDGNEMTDNPGSWTPPAPHSEEIVDLISYGGGAPPGGYPGGNSDYYGAVYTASVYAPVAGDYAFRERVDDAALLMIDGTTVLWDYTAASDFGEPTGNPWTVHSFTSVALSAGWHELEFRWSDHFGGQNAFLEWDPAGNENWSLLGGGAVFADTGSEIGTTTIAGDYTQASGGTLLMDVDADAGEWDLLVVNGTLGAGGALEVNIGGDLPPLGTTYDILDFAAANGLFADVTINGPPLPPAVYWDLSNLYTAGEITLAVPEPTSGALALLAGLAMAAAAVVRRRRKR